MKIPWKDNTLEPVAEREHVLTIHKGQILPSRLISMFGGGEYWQSSDTVNMPGLIPKKDIRYYYPLNLFELPKEN